MPQIFFEFSLKWEEKIIALLLESSELDGLPAADSGEPLTNHQKRLKREIEAK